MPTFCSRSQIFEQINQTKSTLKILLNQNSLIREFIIYRILCIVHYWLLAHCTEVRFASFLFGGFITARKGKWQNAPLTYCDSKQSYFFPESPLTKCRALFLPLTFQKCDRNSAQKFRWLPNCCSKTDNMSRILVVKSC